MTPSWQKYLLGIGLVGVLAYLGFAVYRAGGPTQYLEQLRQQPTGAPVQSIAVSAAPSRSPRPPVVTPKPTTVPPSVSSAPAGEASAVLSAVNARRASAGVPALTTNQTLQQMAQAHAADMVAKGYFSHTDPQGVTFQQRITASGYVGSANAENLGLTSGAAVEVVAGWMDSEGHKLNMLNSQYGAVGVGVAHGVWQGLSAVFVVAVFGNGI